MNQVNIKLIIGILKERLYCFRINVITPFIKYDIISTVLNANDIKKCIKSK